MNEFMGSYIRLCEECFEDLYKVAYLTIGDAGIASELVEKVCVRGVHLCERMKELREIKIALSGELYRLCLEKLLFYPPAAVGSAGKLKGFSPQDRLLLMLRYKSGLRLSELSQAIAMPQKEISDRIMQMMCAGRSGC
ncbi:MAG: hypothetical protein J6K55_13970 [Clostridia bacterium]|nr:hypothetical protein [Clostridia bacterium]